MKLQQEAMKIKKELEKIILNKKIGTDLRDIALNMLSSKYKNTCFINIVEEPEQNLFPESQKNLLFSLNSSAFLSLSPLKRVEI